MSRVRFGLLALPCGAAIFTGMWWARLVVGHTESPAPTVAIQPSRILADGNGTATILIDSRGTGIPRIAVVENPHGAAVGAVTGDGGHWEAHVRAGIVPGRVRFQVALPGSAAVTADLHTVLDARDSLEDGTPDFLRLDDEHDRQAFRRGFTWLAEAPYFQPAASRPAEIVDCAALIRYAYREALHAHDHAWTASARLPLVPPFDSAGKYQYPYTPLGAALFRVRAGPFRAADLFDAAYSQFADAQTLWRWNCRFVSREVRAALPGDLLFFRQEQGRERFHSMIYLGQSQIHPDANRYLVYHTGPDGSAPGEIRRLTVEQLRHFPRSEWRPLASNPGFLGVYRWNILCDTGTD